MKTLKLAIVALALGMFINAMPVEAKEQKSANASNQVACFWARYKYGDGGGGMYPWESDSFPYQPWHERVHERNATPVIRGGDVSIAPAPAMKTVEVFMGSRKTTMVMFDQPGTVQNFAGSKLEMKEVK